MMMKATWKWGGSASHSQVENLLREVNQHPRQRQLWQDAKILGYPAPFYYPDYHWVPLSLLVFNQIWISYLVEDVAIN